MNSAKLFEELGFKLIRNDDDYIIYSKSVNPDGVSKEISFSNQTETVQVYFEDDIQNSQVPSINMQLFKAIEKQLKELKWQ